MNKVLISSLAVIIFILTSCVESYNQTDSITSPIIECSINNGTTKKYVDGTSVKWNEGDQIYVSKRSESNTKTYNLISGEGTTKGVFSSSPVEGFEDSTNVILISPVGKATTVDWPCCYYDVTPTPPLYGYSDKNDANNKKDVPMIAFGKIGQKGGFTFNHIASLLRLKIKNTYSNKIVIKQIDIGSNASNIASRLQININTGVTTIYSDKYIISTIQSEGEVEIDASTTKIFDYVVTPRHYDYISVIVTDTTGRKFSFTKNNISIETGNSYVFDTELSNATEMPTPYQVSIDDGEYVDYIPGKLLANPTTKICFKTKETETQNMSNSDKDGLLSDINNKLADKAIILDLSQIKTWNGQWNNIKINGAFTDIYFPDNVNQIVGAYSFSGCPNAILHLGINLTRVDAALLSGENISLCSGFEVAPGNTEYCSVDRILYSKDTTDLVQRPDFPIDSFSVRYGVTTLKEYSLSNSTHSKIITLPNTITKIEKLVFFGDPVLEAVYFVTETPPSLDNYNGSLKYVIINTGDAGQDLLSKPNYQKEFYGKMADTSKVKTFAEYKLITGM